jgi:hypothetical protein
MMMMPARNYGDAISGGMPTTTARLSQRRENQHGYRHRRQNDRSKAHVLTLTMLTPNWRQRQPSAVKVSDRLRPPLNGRH